MSPEQHLARPHSPLFRAIQKNIEVAGLIDDTVSNTPAKPMPTPVGTLKSRGFFIAGNPPA